MLELEAQMIGAVLMWRTIPDYRETWDAEMSQDTIEDYFTALRKMRRDLDNASG